MVIDGESFVAGWIAGMLLAALLVMLFRSVFGDPLIVPESDDVVAKLARQAFPKLGKSEVYELSILFKRYPDIMSDDDDEDDDDGDEETRPKPTPRFSTN